MLKCFLWSKVENSNYDLCAQFVEKPSNRTFKKFNLKSSKNCLLAPTIHYTGLNYNLEIPIVLFLGFNFLNYFFLVFTSVLVSLQGSRSSVTIKQIIYWAAPPASVVWCGVWGLLNKFGRVKIFLTSFYHTQIFHQHEGVTYIDR